MMKKGFLSQLRQGMKVELEHKDVTKGDPVMTARIALGHLAERKDYYTRLKKAGLNPQSFLKTIKIKYVSQEEINRHLGEPHGHNQGWASAKEGLILIRKGSPEQIKLHEEYHLIAKHPTKPKDPKDYYNQELDADLYAYNKTGTPKHIKQHQMAVFNDLYREYHLAPSKVLRIMESVNKSRKDIPKTWQDDFGYVRKQLAQSLGKNLKKAGLNPLETEVKGIGKVDQGVARLISTLNKRGYRTAYSCSGLEEDHRDDTENCTGGYISWIKEWLTPKQITKIKDAAKHAGMDIVDRKKLNEIDVRPDILVVLRESLQTDKAKKQAWRKFQTALQNPRNPTKGNFAWVLAGLALIAVLAIPMFRNAEGSLTLIEYLRRGR